MFAQTSAFVFKLYCTLLIQTKCKVNESFRLTLFWVNDLFIWLDSSEIDTDVNIKTSRFRIFLTSIVRFVVFL